MSDFEDRLSAVLTVEAGEAPQAAGLAQGARRRHVVRRRRRIAVGGVAAVLAIAAPVAVLAGVGGGDNADDVVGSDAPAGAWQTVESDHAEVEIPAGWREVECDFDGFTRLIYGPADSDPCTFGVYAAFFGSATFDPATLPGVVTRTEEDGKVSWTGYVSAGDWVVDVGTPERELTVGILSSARVDGQPKVVVDGWREHSADGLTYLVPADEEVGVRVTDRPEGEPVSQSLPEQIDEATVRMYGDVGDLRVTVTAPTRAVAELVLSSVTPSSSTDELRQFEVEGVQFEVPAQWAQLDCPTFQGLYGAGAERCGRGEYLALYARAIFDPAMRPNEIIQSEDDGVTLWTGYVYAGDWAVYVRTQERQLTEDILATVRE